MKCLVCYEDTRDSGEYHQKCSNYLFGTKSPPSVSFGAEQINDLAKGIVLANTTIPGVQKKLSAHIQNVIGSEARITLVGLWGGYILKPSSAEYPLLPKLEDCTMKVAAALGITTMKHGLIRMASGELAYLTKRHDRERSLPVFHMEDGCQLTKTLTEYKYRCSTEKLGKCIRNVVSHTLLDVIRYYEMIIVSFLTGNADMHLKNFSIFYRDMSSVRIAPAYDMVSTRLLIPEKSDNEELALTLNGKKQKLNFDDFLIAGKHCGLTDNQVRNAIKRICKKIPQASKVIQKSFLPEGMISDFFELLTERSQRIS